MREYDFFYYDWKFMTIFFGAYIGIFSKYLTNCLSL